MQGSALAPRFFRLVSARYERGSIILASNKRYGDWGGIFGDPIIATTILVRMADSIGGTRPLEELSSSCGLK
jgi:DNA replication protein DnaC